MADGTRLLIFCAVMRSPKRKHEPRRIVARELPVGVDLGALAEEVHYVGSQEHKTHPSFAGPPKPRMDASQCDKAFAGELELVNRWLRSAIRRGQVGLQWEGRYPRYAWYYDEESKVV